MDNEKTVVYSKVQGLDIKVDIYVPSILPAGSHPALVLFHGGGMVAGNRQGVLIQQWLIEKCAKNGIIFLSADYRLLCPATGFDIIEDVTALFAYLAAPDFSSENLPSGINLDTSRIAVTGESGGGYASYAAAIYASPRPCALLQQYAMGGNILLDQWLKPRENLPNARASAATREMFSNFLDADKQTLVADDPIGAYSIGKVPADLDSKRLGLFALWSKTGELLDYILGMPGISKKLAKCQTVAEREKMVPSAVKKAVLQLNVNREFPPILIMHGDKDGWVPVEESISMHERLLEVGVQSELMVVAGADHVLAKPGGTMEFISDVDEIHNKMMAWLLKELKSTAGSPSVQKI